MTDFWTLCGQFLKKTFNNKNNPIKIKFLFMNHSYRLKPLKIPCVLLSEF